MYHRIFHLKIVIITIILLAYFINYNNNLRQPRDTPNDDDDYHAHNRNSDDDDQNYYTHNPDDNHYGQYHNHDDDTNGSRYNKTSFCIFQL